MSVRPTYPVVLLPPRLEAALTARPERPSYPKAPPRPEDFPVNLSAGKSLLSTLYGLVGLKGPAAELTAPERQQAAGRYEAALGAYERARAAFWEEEARQWTPAVMQAFRQRQVAALLESSARERAAESTALAGPAEAQLYETLDRHFPGLIHRRRRLRAGPEDYHPDYLLADPASRLRLDIELDEPYTLRHQMPIHFVEQDPVSGAFVSLDATRDAAFLAAGWPVLRFSEAQAVRDPDGCARVVAEVLECLTGRVTPSLVNVKPVTPEDRWTRQDANVLASQDARAILLSGVKRGEAPPVPRTPPRAFVPSEHQARIFDFLERGEGHGLVVAVAGSGKSTTLLQAVQSIRRGRPDATIALLAFNRSIKEELQAKLRDAGLHGVEVATLNGFGHRVLLADRGGPERLKLTRNKERNVLARAAETLGRRLTPEDLNRAANLYGKFQSYVQLDPADPEHFRRLAEQYNVRGAEGLQDVVALALQQTLQDYRARGTFTLDEQNYLPVKLELPIKPYDFVFVDECQDLTQTQLELVRRAAGQGGRLLFVGDPRQAIMGFRGADNDSVRNIRALDPAPTELPLTVCYRCPESHLRLARTLMPSIQAAPGAKEGEVHELGWDDAFAHIREGDLLFARSNALVDRLVLELLVRGLTLDYTPVRAGPQNDEEGSTSARVSQVMASLLRAAPNFDPRSAPGRRPELKRGDAPLEKWTPWVLGQLHRQAKDWDGGAFEAYMELATRPDERLGVRVSSAHQSKGLEARRVFVMGYSLFGQPRQDQQAWEFEQEENLRYVALTRAKETLYLVGAPNT